MQCVHWEEQSDLVRKSLILRELANYVEILILSLGDVEQLTKSCYASVFATVVRNSDKCSVSKAILVIPEKASVKIQAYIM